MGLGTEHCLARWTPIFHKGVFPIFMCMIPVWATDGDHWLRQDYIMNPSNTFWVMFTPLIPKASRHIKKPRTYVNYPSRTTSLPNFMDLISSGRVNGMLKFQKLSAILLKVKVMAKFKTVWHIWGLAVIMFVFVSRWMDHFFLRYIKYLILKIQGHIWGLAFNLYVCFSFCDKWTFLFPWDTASQIFDLQNFRSR